MFARYIWKEYTTDNICQYMLLYIHIMCQLLMVLD